MLIPSSSHIQLKASFSLKYKSLTAFPTLGEISIQKKYIVHCCSSCNLKDEREQNGIKKSLKRRRLLVFLVSTGFNPTLSSSGKTKIKNPYDEKRLLEQNKRVQRENNAPDDFPSFVREGFEVKVVASDNYVKRESGLIYRDFEAGTGDFPKSGQQVTFHYLVTMNRVVELIVVTNKELPPKYEWELMHWSQLTERADTGFEEGIKDMKPGGKRRIIIPPELGPPVGPSTFFSAKQFEVFDVEMLGVKDCTRRTIAFYSDVVCD